MKNAIPAHNLLGVNVHACEPEQAIQAVLDSAQQQQHLSVACLASYSLVAAINNPDHQKRLNALSLKVCDGQPVRWALNHFYRVRLQQRVYGPKLMSDLISHAEQLGLPCYFYGGNPPALEGMLVQLAERHPALKIAGMHAGRYERISAAEQAHIAQTIRDSGARLVFVGLGTPRQDIWLYEHRDLIPAPCIAVGAAFDYYANLLTPPPAWMGRWGLQWLHRLLQDPQRLWRRYLLNNSRYVYEMLRQQFRGPRAPLHGEAPYRGDA
ncbi:MAG: glycosyltransferase [Oceanococcus sp.]|nr:MAG: glycosyltransferase [Oceanococcus sp.]